MGNYKNEMKGIITELLAVVIYLSLLLAVTGIMMR
jgi:hypothetical protein